MNLRHSLLVIILASSLHNQNLFADCFINQACLKLNYFKKYVNDPAYFANLDFNSFHLSEKNRGAVGDDSPISSFNKQKRNPFKKTIIEKKYSQGDKSGNLTENLSKLSGDSDSASAGISTLITRKFSDVLPKKPSKFVKYFDKSNSNVNIISNDESNLKLTPPISFEVSDDQMVKKSSVLNTPKKIAKRNLKYISPSTNVVQAQIEHKEISPSFINDSSAYDLEWNKMYNLLVKYGDSHNDDCNIPLHYTTQYEDKTINLGKWLSRQRELYRQKTLPTERKKKLQILINDKKLTWKTRNAEIIHDNKWNDMYSLLLDYGIQNNGDYNVPQKFIITSPNSTVIKLGDWLSRQRRYYRLGKLREIRKVKLQLLVDTGNLSWKFDADEVSLENSWEQKYNLLLKYGLENGDCNVPKRFTCIDEKGNNPVELGVWLSKQRSYRKAGKLPEARRLKLQKLVDDGKFSWSVDRVAIITDDKTWKNMYKLLLMYGMQHKGDCNAPKDFEVTLSSDTRVKVGNWLSTQRKLYRKGTLLPERLEMLKKLVDTNKLWIDPPQR